MKKRRAITLIEMIVVMLLIATITGAIAYNYKESLNQGKVFKTKEGVSRIETILNLALAERPEEADQILNNWQDEVSRSPLVKNPKDFLRDAWGGPFIIKVETNHDGQPFFKVDSENLRRYEQNRRQR